MEKLEESPLGWEINLLWMFLQSASILVEDIDMQLKIKTNSTSGFIHEKKKYIKNYERCLKEAEQWMLKFGLDNETYNAVGGHSGMYSNTVASANELIRMAMLHIDRAHCEGGSYRTFKALRALPSSGIFPDKYIDRFQMKYVVVPEIGDRVLTTNHGQGVLLLHVGGKNWNVRLADNKEIVLNESQFKVL